MDNMLDNDQIERVHNVVREFEDSVDTLPSALQSIMREQCARLLFDHFVLMAARLSGCYPASAEMCTIAADDIQKIIREGEQLCLKL